MVATEALLDRQDNGPVATLTLNRPDSRNALSLSLIAALQDALDGISGDDIIRVIIITGSGSAFCAGHDLKEFTENPNKAYYDKIFYRCSKLMQTIIAQPQPVIAQVNGMATAAGCQLVATCDLAVASTNAHFATPGVNIGLFCSTPMVALSRNLSRKHALEMLLTGDPVDADTAQAIGLINRVVDAEHLAAETHDLALKIASKSALTLAIGKEAFYRQVEMPLEEAYDYASEVMTRNMLTLDAQEGIDAFLAKRDPQWRNH